MKKRDLFNKKDAIFVGSNLAAAVIIVVVVLTCLILWLRGYTQHGTEITVANVRGLTQEQAETILHEQGLSTVIVDSTYSSTFWYHC